MGGGGFGGNAGEANRDDAGNQRRPKPESDETQGLWTGRTAVLSPGDRVEFKFDGKKGETLMATAVSDAFDPALSAVDAKGKEIAKNDDREQGDQSPFLIVRFPEAGTYTLKVLSYGSKSGGKFTVRFRTFTALDAPLGPGDLTMAAPTPDQTASQGSWRVVFRLTAKKGKVYDLRTPIETKPNRMGLAFVRIIGPTGVEENDVETIPVEENTPVFLAKADGDYYFEYAATLASDQPATFHSDFREVALVPAKPTETVTLDVEPYELKIVELPVKPNLIVKTSITGPVNQKLSAPGGTKFYNGDNSDGAYGNTSMWTWFYTNKDDANETVRIFHGTGTARFALRSYSNKPEKATLTNSESLPEWKSGQPINDDLNIGDARLYLLKSDKSELMKVFAKSPTFQAKLDIFRLNGQLANSIMDRHAHVAQDDLYFPEADTYVVRLICDGYGGSGDYTMRRDTAVPKPYALGALETLTLDGSNFGLYEVNLEAGKRYEFIVDHPDWQLGVDLIDDDGQFITSQGMNFEGVAVQYFVPPHVGRYRLWLRAGPGQWHFKLQPNIPPSLQ
ncbi:hypothetical protein BH11ARM2_BH11ARM2_00550 [soil metagenome]